MASVAAAHTSRIFSVLEDRAATAKSAVAASWSRSVKHGLEPDGHRSPHQLSRSEFNTLFEGVGPMVASAQHTLDRLFQSVGDAGCCIVLSNCEGVILDRRINLSDESEFRDLRPGVVWSEAAAGTNAVGTALREGRSLTIHRDQHFMARHIEMSCTAAPIRDAEGKIIGALDVSIARRDLTTAVLKLVESATCEAAQKIEARCFREAFRDARIVLLPDQAGGSGGAIAVDRHDLVVGANYIARRTYGLSDKDLAEPFPAGQLLAPAEAALDSLEVAEYGAVQRALARAGGTVSVAAQFLGISRATLHRKISKFRNL
jgi:transcriptional regulator of acetoin/glycerol metabolism